MDNPAVVYTEAMLRRNYADLRFCPQNHAEDLAESKQRSIKRLMDAVPGFQAYYSDEDGLPFPETLRSPAFQRLIEAAFLADDEKGVYAAVNAEEHLLVMARGTEGQIGLLVDKVYQMVNQVAGNYDPFAKDEKYGFLSFKPIFAGSGLHVQILLHLPMLSFFKQIPSLTESFGQQGCTLRSLGTTENRNPARLYMLSNAYSQGMGEQQIIEKVSDVLHMIVRKERALQERALGQQFHSGTMDQVWRSYGILKYARRLTTADFLTHWSNLRLGAGMEALPLSTSEADKMLKLAGDHEFLQQKADIRTYSFRRAEMVRQILTGGD